MRHLIVACVMAGAILVPVSVQAQTCKQARSCEDAVRMWCNGYGRADRDNDGIPCESVCHSRSQVEAIMKRIGCNK